MIRFYTLFSLPDKISKVFRVFFAKFDFLATLSHFLHVIGTNPCRWKCKNGCYNKICEKNCSGDQWSPEFEKIGVFQILAKIVAPPVARSVIFDKIDRMMYFTRPSTMVCQYNAQNQSTATEKFQISHIFIVVLQLMISNFHSNKDVNNKNVRDLKLLNGS